VNCAVPVGGISFLLSGSAKFVKMSMHGQLLGRNFAGIPNLILHKTTGMWLFVWSQSEQTHAQ